MKLKMNRNGFILFSFIGLLVLHEANCLQKRCIKCRSRGELGTCGDPFPFNVTNPEIEVGIHMVACPSGWCAKIIEGTSGAYRVDDYGASTERTCMQRPPSDYEERCAHTLMNYRKVYMCFCTGDLCNAAFRISTLPTALMLTFIVIVYNSLEHF